ncbi:MAG: hypothetical protein ACXWP4_00625 [Polyangiales bacterium]
MRALVIASVIASLTVVGCSSSSEDPGNPVNDSSVSGETSTSTDSSSPSSDSTTDSTVDAVDAADTSVVDTATDATAESSTTEAATEAGVSCTGKGDTCSSAEVCLFSVGACGAGTGTCVTRPSKGACSSSPTDPVCGCDGNDYSNTCFALLSGTSVAKSGSCGPKTCGNGSCDLGEDCSTCPGDCGSCAGCGDGVCVKGVEDCASCAADCCATVCTESTKCAGDQFCKFTTGACKVKGSTGSCVPAPTSCPPPGAGDTVCGCDGTSYTSECVAASSGTSVDHTGLCP